MSAPPRYATERDPSRATDGDRIAAVGRALARPFLPWQRLVCDVATERDAFGRLVYEIVFVTVPRQSGKTTLIWALVCDRLLSRNAARVFYTAQTQQDARRRVQDFEQLATDSPFSRILRFRKSMSDTGATCLVTRSTLGTFAPGPTALHGETPELVILDEAFAHSLELGDAMLEDAIIPAQQTLAGRRQVWIISTAGTAASGFMRKWRDIGREGKRPRMAYFEWSMPDGVDPLDPATLEGFHPAVGHPLGDAGTILTAEDILASRPKSMSAYLRAFGNRFQDAHETVVDLDRWDGLALNDAAPRRRDVAVAFEVALDGSAASVVAAWRDVAGHPHVHTLHTAPGTAWLAPFVRRIHDEWRPRVVGADYGAATRRVVDEVTLGGVPVTRLTATEFATATDSILTAVRDGVLVHDGSATLRRGVAGAALHRAGETSRFSRAHSPGYVAGIIAAAVALRVYDHAPAPLAKPTVTF